MPFSIDLCPNLPYNRGKEKTVEFKRREEGIIDSNEVEKKKFYQNLYVEYRKRMLNYSRRILGNEQDAEDAVQETFVNLYKHLNKLMGLKAEETKGYIFRAVHNVSISIVEQKKKTYASEDSELERYEAEINMEGDVLGNLSFDEMIEVAVSMDPEYGKMIRLKYEQGKSAKEIAQEIGRPIDSTRALMSRMILRMRKKLKGGDWL